jgi:hypothetical protein
VALAADYGTAWFSLIGHLLVASFALLMERILQGNCILGCLRTVTGAAGLPFTAPVVQIGIEIMMALQTVNLIGMFFVIEYNSRPFMFSQFAMVQSYHRFLGESQRSKNRDKKDDRQKLQIFHQNSFRCKSGDRFTLPRQLPRV